MPDPVMRPQSAPLRMIALRLAVPDLSDVAKQPEVIEVFRLTIRYHDGRFADQLATIARLRTQEAARFSAAYRRANDKPLTLDLNIDAARYQAFSAAMRRLNYDRLDDMPDIPWFGADLWLLERASGSFHHDVIIAPDSAAGTHAEIVRLVREHLREAVRTIHP